MGSLVPDKTIAERPGTHAIVLAGCARDGKRSYVQYEIFSGGVGFVREYRILRDVVPFSMRTDKHTLAPKASTAATPRRHRRASSTPAPRTSGGCYRFGDQRLETGDMLRVE